MTSINPGADTEGICPVCGKGRIRTKIQWDLLDQAEYINVIEKKFIEALARGEYYREIAAKQAALRNERIEMWPGDGGTKFLDQDTVDLKIANMNHRQSEKPMERPKVLDPVGDHHAFITLIKMTPDKYHDVIYEMTLGGRKRSTDDGNV